MSENGDQEREVRNIENVFLPSDAGIAIGPILFVIAILGLIATVISSNIGSYGSTSVIDRIAADIPSQANLIQAKINECNLKYGTVLESVYPNTGGTVTLVSALNCPGDPTGSQNLWTGLRPAVLPQPTSGFAAWNYVSNTTGGICIFTSPSSPSNNTLEGLKRAIKKYANQTTCNNSSTPCSSEVLFNPASAAQKFVLWISLPSASSAPDPNCLP